MQKPGARVSSVKGSMERLHGCVLGPRGEGRMVPTAHVQARKHWPVATKSRPRYCRSGRRYLCPRQMRKNPEATEPRPCSILRAEPHPPGLPYHPLDTAEEQGSKNRGGSHFQEKQSPGWGGEGPQPSREEDAVGMPRAVAGPAGSPSCE